ncbi:MAG: DUF4097 family beta strand repeat protein [Clostridia bacterium]|nr:DUF4097 family beta strand repeat protein [Clostridia bacterium]
MSKGTKGWLIAAGCLVLIGCMLFGGAMTALNWDFTKLSTGKYETNVYNITDDFRSISVQTDTADLVFAVSEDETCSVSCYENEKAKYTVSVEDDTLIIKLENKKAWYEYIGINFSSPKITVSLPKAEYASLLVRGSTGDLTVPNAFTFESIDVSLNTGTVEAFASATGLVKVKASTGNIKLENLTAGALDLSVSTGRITMSNVTCKEDITFCVSTGKSILSHVKCNSLTTDGDTGDLTLADVIAEKTLTAERTTGDVRLEDVDASDIVIKTDTGDVTGNLRSAKVFITQTDTGRMDVPKTMTGGRCEITTDTGDIKLQIR